MNPMTPRIERIEGTVMAVNSYLIHGPGGIIVVDGQLTIADADAVRGAIERSGREPVAMVITHPHPDHYAGAGRIVSPEVPILATAEVAQVIHRDDRLKDTIVGPMMGGQWPASRRFPDQLVEPGSTVSLAGVELSVRAAGPGESPADSIWSIGNSWFTGDIVCPHLDAYLADGHYSTWLDSLGQLSRDAPADAIFYPGHGAPASRAGIAVQRAYIETFVEAVRRSLSLDAEQRRGQVLARMAPLLTDRRLQFLMELSIEPVAAELRGSGVAAARP
jgi:glyoxylase-like metal-dependent hydrolase (beta-lactamase superfamily II)